MKKIYYLFLLVGLVITTNSAWAREAHCIIAVSKIIMNELGEITQSPQDAISVLLPLPSENEITKETFIELNSIAKKTIHKFGEHLQWRNLRYDLVLSPSGSFDVRISQYNKFLENSRDVLNASSLFLHRAKTLSFSPIWEELYKARSSQVKMTSVIVPNSSHAEILPGHLIHDIQYNNRFPRKYLELACEI